MSISTATAPRARSPTARGTANAATRPVPELAHAYAALLTRDDLNGQTFDLNGTPITQAELTQYMNAAYGTELTYRSMSAEDYVADRTAELGDFIGPIIGGIYDGIRRGAFDAPGDYEAATGRPASKLGRLFRLAVTLIATDTRGDPRRTTNLSEIFAC